MGRRKEQPEDVKPEKNVTYYATYFNYGFMTPKVDEEGKIIYRKNNQGGDILDSEGNKMPIMINRKFQNVEPLVSKGYLSKFEWNASDKSAQNQMDKKTLDKLDDDEGVNVENQDKYDKRINPKAYEEKKRAEAFEGKIAELEDKLNDPEELQRRLEELTRP